MKIDRYKMGSEGIGQKLRNSDKTIILRSGVTMRARGKSSDAMAQMKDRFID